MVLSVRELRQYSNKRVFAALAAIMLVALVATGAIIYCVYNVLNTRQASIQITKIQSEMDDFYIQLLNAETGQRGYLLTGNELYLQPYELAQQKIPGQIKVLVGQSAPYPYAGKMKLVQTVTMDKLRELGETVALRKSDGPDAALTTVETDEGKADMDQLRSLLGTIGKQQSSDLAAKRLVASEYGVKAIWVGVIMLVAIMVLAMLVYYLFLQAIKAERSLDQAKDEFVTLASHQLRTPASGIKSILSVLSAEDFGPLNDRQRHLVARAIQSNERELRIVEELLMAARAEGGHLVMKPSEVDVTRLVAAVVAELKGQVEKKRQSIKVDRPKPPVRVWGDEEKLFMALSNIIDNASKYTGEGGTIGVQVRGDDESVSVAVSDTGVGIEKAELENIFDRFARSQESLMSGAEGTGLGLYLARRIAWLHNGNIKVESKKGEGSVFILTLPCGEPSDAA